MTSTLNKTSEGIKLYTKGSLDTVIDRCSYIYEKGQVIKLTRQRKQGIKRVIAKKMNIIKFWHMRLKK